MSHRVAKVFMHDVYAGVLEETNDGSYQFTYTADYLQDSETRPVSLTLPKRKEAFSSDRLFAFFDGLIPEGWLLHLVSKNWKIQENDRMSLLLASCQDCIGAVHIMPFEEATL